MKGILRADMEFQEFQFISYIYERFVATSEGMLLEFVSSNTPRMRRSPLGARQNT
jgi:hypothetical protein